MTLQILDPVQAPRPDSYECARRLSTLDGAVLGLFSNEKLNATRLLEFVAEELSNDFDFSARTGKYHVQKMMSPAEWGDVDDCDVVLLANGDCGACSSSGIVNAIELEKRGIPTVLISTTPFRAAVQTMAGLRGMRDIRWAVVDHPIARVEDDALRDRARSAAKQFLDIVLDGDR